MPAEPGVEVLGHVAEGRLQALYASAAALLYPSEQEGFGLPVVEAMAMGCPVIALRRDALVEVGGDAPIYLEEAKAESIALAMASILADAALRARCRELGLAQASKFRPEAFAARVRDEIRTLLVTCTAAPGGGHGPLTDSSGSIPAP